MQHLEKHKGEDLVHLHQLMYGSKGKVILFFRAKSNFTIFKKFRKQKLKKIFVNFLDSH